MDGRCLELAEDFVSARYIEAGRESLNATTRTIRSVLAQRRCPEEGLSDPAIQLLLRQLALMDTNNFTAHVGGGEREGRVIAALVRERHFGFTHGIGRSGDLTAEQPKAGGSSLLYQLTNMLMLDLIRLAGAPSTKAAVVVPMATGMTLALVLRCVAKARSAELAQQQNRKTEPTATAAVPPVVPQYVIWPRIDQKTSLKCIDTAGLIPVPVPLRPAPPMRHRTTPADVSADGATNATTSATATLSSSDKSATTSSATSTLFLQCEVDDIAAAVDAVGGPSHVVCVLSTTSCFAPRLPDNTVAISQYCKSHDIPYVVNNAYGVQSRRIMARLDAAQRLGRLDYFVQSGDKNFLVPVGGSIVCSASPKKCQAAAALYAGRASASPIIDLLITALSLGRRGMKELWEERYVCRRRLVAQLRSFAEERGELVLVDDTEDTVLDLDRPSTSRYMKEWRSTLSSADRSGNADATSAQKTDKKRMTVLPRNDISIAITMRYFGSAGTSASDKEEEEKHEDSKEARATTMMQDKWAAARAFGAQLFRSAVTGPRVILPAPAKATTIAGCTFHNYGMHQEGVPAFPMLVIACGIGTTVNEVDSLMLRLRELWPVRRRQN